VHREEPLAFAVADVGPAWRQFDANEPIGRRQHHAVVKFFDDGAGGVLQCDEVEDVVVFVERALDLDGSAVIMPVQALALVAFVADEMAATEDQIILRHTDLVALTHLMAASVANGKYVIMVSEIDTSPNPTRADQAEAPVPSRTKSARAEGERPPS